MFQADKYSYIHLPSEEVKLKAAEMTFQKEIGRHRAAWASWVEILSCHLCILQWFLKTRFSHLSQWCVTVSHKIKSKYSPTFETSLWSLFQESVLSHLDSKKSLGAPPGRLNLSEMPLLSTCLSLTIWRRSVCLPWNCWQGLGEVWVQICKRTVKLQIPFLQLDQL